MISPHHAITRAVSPSLVDCLLTHMERDHIDVDLAVEQHDAYERVLRDAGLDVLSLPAEPTMPDSVFVEDTAVVVDEVAVVTRPASPSRRTETDSVASMVRRYRPLACIEEPGTLEGGDVLRVDKQIYVGRSSRTNDNGIRQLRGILGPLGYTVSAVDVEKCLHLKTACTAIGRRTLLANPDWVDTSVFRDLQVIAVSEGEDFAGNALLVNGTVVLPAGFLGTREDLQGRGFTVQSIDVSELQKAEAGLTCCSILF
jgi:dimethylargininase